jgi:8-oxo-dGTP pyrophosphatase MutT (NUDIX family)
MGAGVLFLHGGKALILKRAEGLKYWGFPGGKSEKLESPLQTAFRETREEIGYLPICTVQGHFAQEGYILYFALCREFFTPKLNREHSEYRWVDLEKLKEMKIHPREIRGIDYLLSSLSITQKGSFTYAEKHRHKQSQKY